MPSSRTLICGSLAVDTIMVFPDRFGRHILADQVHMLSVSFQIGQMRREWGGCAGNIAYHLKGLGGEPVVMATLGDDDAADRAAAKIPFMFDPGQGLPLFSGPELIEMIDAATYVAVNDYEGRLLAERTGLTLEAIAQRVEALVVTQGADGSQIHAGGRVL